MFTRIIVAGPLGGQAAGSERDLSAAAGPPNYTAVIYPQAHPQAVDNSPLRWVDRDSMSTSPVGKPGSMPIGRFAGYPCGLNGAPGYGPGIRGDLIKNNPAPGSGSEPCSGRACHPVPPLQ